MVLAFRKISKNTNKWLLLCKLCGKIIVGGKVVKSQLTTRFQSLAQSERLTPFNTQMILYNYLVTWKHQHRKYKKYRKEDFYYDGFMWNLTNSSHSILYIFDYKYDDRHTRKRLWNMQEFISKHCFDSEINSSSISRLVLNKTNSKCIDTLSYINDFKEYILLEIAIIKPTIIVACGCYDVISNMLEQLNNESFLSAIKNIPILEMLPPTFKTNDKYFQLHFENVYFRKFGWNI